MNHQHEEDRGGCPKFMGTLGRWLLLGEYHPHRRHAPTMTMQCIYSHCIKNMTWYWTNTPIILQ
jgi:hypothetical protein